MVFFVVVSVRNNRIPAAFFGFYHSPAGQTQPRVWRVRPQQRKQPGLGLLLPIWNALGAKQGEDIPRIPDRARWEQVWAPEAGSSSRLMMQIWLVSFSINPSNKHTEKEQHKLTLQGRVIPPPVPTIRRRSQCGGQGIVPQDKIVFGWIQAGTVDVEIFGKQSRTEHVPQGCQLSGC